jgi:hypothetical protein
LTSILDIWAGAPAGTQSVPFSKEEEDAFSRTFRNSIHERGIAGVGVMSETSPPYTENAYFAASTIAALGLAGKFEAELDNLSIYFDGLWNETYGFIEIPADGFEPYTFYYAICAKALCGSLNQLERSQYAEILGNFLSGIIHRKLAGEMIDIATLFWIGVSANTLGCLDTYKSDILQSVEKCSSATGGYATMPTPGLAGTIPATGMALTLRRLCGEFQVSAETHRLVRACVRDDGITEVAGGAVTWAALKWGTVAAMILNISSQLRVPRIRYGLDLWQIHCIAIARYALRNRVDQSPALRIR